MRMARTKQAGSGESPDVRTWSSVLMEATRLGSGEAGEVENQAAASEPQVASWPPALYATSRGRVMCPTCGHVTVVIAP